MDSSVHQMVSLIMAAKPLNVIIGQPTTETMNRMIEQMAQMVAPIKTTAWGGCHGSLALVLDNADYSNITKARTTSTTPVTQQNAINKGIMATSTPLKILTFQEETKKLQKEFDLQEVVTNIGVQRIIDSVEEQYIEELNKKKYFGYANNTIKSVRWRVFASSEMMTLIALPFFCCLLSWRPNVMMWVMLGTHA